MLCFKTVTTSFGVPGKNTELHEQFWTLSELKNAMRKSILTETDKQRLKVARYNYAHLVEGRPAFIWVGYCEFSIVEVRMISRKEFEYSRNREAQENLDAWTEYGERKWGC